MAHILVVDDDPDIVELVVTMLSPKHDVEGTTLPEVALNLLGTSDYQLVITDVRMPEMNGFQFVTEARRIRPKINVLVISAYYDDTEPLCQDVMRQYATMALPKPLDFKSMQATVDWCLIR